MITLTSREADTTLAALRIYQHQYLDQGESSFTRMAHFADGTKPLTPDETDALCDMISCNHSEAGKIKLLFENTYHDDGDTIKLEATGDTLLQALATLEAKLIQTYGEEADFKNHSAFPRDIESFFEDLDQVGGILNCYDFSCPEEGFNITRLA